MQWKRPWVDCITEYKVTWKNDDGSIIKTENVTYGKVPTCDNPTKEASRNKETLELALSKIRHLDPNNDIDRLSVQKLAERNNKYHWGKFVQRISVNRIIEIQHQIKEEMKEITDVKFLYWDNPEAFPSWGDFTFNLGDKRIYFLYDDFNFYYSYKGYGEKNFVINHGIDLM